MVFKKAGLATLLVVGLLVVPANAGMIYDWTSPPAEWGWSGVYEEEGDDDVAAFLLWGFAVAALWPNGTGGWGALQPPVKPPPPPPEPPEVGEEGTVALFGVGLVLLLWWRQRRR